MWQSFQEMGQRSDPRAPRCGQWFNDAQVPEGGETVGRDLLVELRQSVRPSRDKIRELLDEQQIPLYEKALAIEFRSSNSEYCKSATLASPRTHCGFSI
jgi:hypothetical protein